MWQLTLVLYLAASLAVTDGRRAGEGYRFAAYVERFKADRIVRDPAPIRRDEDRRLLATLEAELAALEARGDAEAVERLRRFVDDLREQIAKRHAAQEDPSSSRRRIP